MVQKLSLAALLLLGSFAASAATPPRTEVTPIPVAPAAPGSDYFATRFREVAAELPAVLSGPRAAVVLYRLHALAPDLPSLDPLAALLKKTADEKKALPEVRALARYLLADVNVSLGHPDAAKADLKQLGFATSGWLIGGFDNEGGAGHTTSFPPEQGPIDLKATAHGKDRDVVWRSVPEVGPMGFVPVSDLLRPVKNATFYVATQLNAPAAGPAVLHFGASGATKLWVNGFLIADDPDDHPARYDQRAAKVALKKGANTVLLKVSTLEEQPAYILRAAREDGGPLVGAAFTLPAPQEALVACDTASRPTPANKATDITAALEALADKQPKDGRLRQDFATVLELRRAFDSKQQRSRREQERAATLLPKDARARAILANYIDNDQNVRREALEQALELDPAFVPARTVLSHYYEEHGFARRAYDEAEKAVTAAGDYYPAQLALSDALDGMDMDARAQRVAVDLAARFPNTPRVQLAAARTERTLGKVAQAMERYRHVLALRYDDKEARAELTNLLVDSGDVDGALALLTRATELSPTAIGPAVRLADLLSFNGRSAEAVAMYDRLTQLAPDDDAVFEARGQHCLRDGDTAGALKDFKHALALKPQNPHLRDLVSSVEPHQEDFAAPFLRDAMELAKASKDRTNSPDEDSVVLANVDVVRVYPNGLSSRVHQQVVRVLNDRGVDQNRGQHIRYSSGDQELKIEKARIIKKDGSVVEARSENDQHLSDSYAGMYFDSRQRSVVFASLEPGDVVELLYRRDDISQQNMFADYFGDVTYLQGTDARLDQDYVLIAPAGRTFYANAPTLPGVQHTEGRTADGQQIQRWRTQNVPRIEPEPKMPGWANVAAYLHVSTFKSWDDMARFWWGLIHDQLHVTPEVAQAAEEAVKGIPESDLPGRVRAVYDYVVTKTRYVGLEFGIHGFKPYNVDQILSRRFGDCKDKASLMYAMLNHLGIKSNMVLLRTRAMGQLSTQPASLAVFNHAILYVPQLNRFLDGTAEFSGSGELPDQDQSAQALVVQDDGGVSQLQITPMSQAKDNITDNDYQLDVSSDGSAVLHGTASVRGYTAQSWRRAYESETGRRERFEQSYAPRYPGVKAVSFDIGDTRSIEKPVQTSFSLSIPRLAQKDGDALVFSPFGEPWHYLEGNAPQSKRTYPIDLGTPYQHEFHYVVHLPTGYSATELPAAADKTTPFGSFHYDLKTSPEGLVVHGTVSFVVSEVKPASYDAFRSFLEELDRTFSRRVRVARTAPTTEASR
jgi:tetratricopeptide (TPR) repeat protein